MRKLLQFICLVVVGILPVTGKTQILLTNSAPAYTQNFDAMAATLILPSNWRVSANGSTPVFATASTTVTQQVSSGSPATGGTYNFGSTSTERAVGTITSGSYASPNNYMSFYQNNGTSAITSLTVSYNAERYRINTAAASIQFYFSTDGSTWTSVSAGDIAASSFPTGANSYTFASPLTIIKSGITVSAINIAAATGVFYLRWNLNTTGSNSQGIAIDDVSVTANYAATGPSISNSVPALTGFNYISGAGPSATQAFTITGTNLTNPVTITPTNTNFEFSVDGGSSYGTAPVTLTNAASVSQPVIVRLVAGLAIATYTGQLDVSSTGATTVSTTLSGAVTGTPSIVVNPSALSGFSSTSGTVSAEQSFTVTGSNLTANAVVTAPADYEVSLTTATGFATSVTVPQAAGNIASTTIFVRIKAAAAAGSPTGNITVVSGTASQSVAVSGTVASQPTLTASPATLTGFSAILGNASTSQSFTVSGSSLTGNATVTPPSKYELSTDNITFQNTAITLAQAAGTLTGQPVTVYVRLAATAAAGTANQNVTVASAGAISQTVALTGTVAQPSLTATPGTLSGFTTTLGTASAAQTFTLSGANLTANAQLTVATGSYEISSDGITYNTSLSLPQSGGTITGQPITIYARITAAASGGAANGTVQISSTAAATQTVTLTGTVTGPALTASAAVLAGFSTAVNTASAAQTFTVNGSNLSANAMVTAPAGFEVSTDNITFSNIVTLAQSGGTITGQPVTIYARIASSPTGGIVNGNIMVASTNATTQNIAVSGSISTAFTAGNIVVVRVGDGVTTLANTGDQVFLDEYNPSGTTVNSIPLPSTAASGANLVLSGVSTSEGFLTRSANGQYLAIGGYNKSLPNATALTSLSVDHDVAIVKYDGTTDLSTSLTDYAVGNSPRAAYTVDGNALYVAGATGGIRYTTKGATTSTSLSSTTANVRTINVAEIGAGVSQLVVTSSSGAIRTATVGTGLPTTTGQTITNLPGTPAGGSPYQSFFADLNPAIDGVDVLYLADDGAGIIKYSLVAGSWVANGTVGSSTDLYRGITGVVNNTTGAVTIYATGGFDATPTGAGGRIITFTDNTGYNGAIGTPTVTTLSNLGTGSKKSFRGIALAPFNATASNTFVGDLSANFNLGLNYGSGLAPTIITDAVIIANGPMLQPVVTGTSSHVQNLTIGAGASVTVPAGALLDITGNIANSGTFYTTNGDLSFTMPAGIQQIPGFTANNATFNGSGFNLNGNSTVNGTLNLYNGIITNTGFTLNVTSTATTAISGGFSTAYIIGNLTRAQSATVGNQYFYPVGSATRFRPIRITNAGVTGLNTFATTYFPTVYPITTPTNSAYHISTLEYWDISRISGTASDPVDVSLITTSTAASGMMNIATVEVGHFNGATWDNLGNNTANTSFGSFGAEIKTTGVTNFSPFTFMSQDIANPLPLAIRTFDLEKIRNEAARLSWVVDKSSGASSVELERSADGQQFATINTVTNTEMFNGVYVDPAPANAGVAFYRLKVSDAAGKATYSPVLTAKYIAADALSLYPNPAENKTTLTWTNASVTSISIANVIGRQVYNKTFDGTSAVIDLSDLAAGEYLLSWKQENIVKHVKLTIMH